jgi:predicted nucleic acid-binding protein
MKLLKKIYYIDTNVILDSMQDRKNLFGKDISSPSIKLFWNSISCNFYMGISTWTLKELSRYISPAELKPFFDLAKNKIKIMKYDDEDVKLAKKRSNSNFDDALHIIIAEKNKVDYIITRDINHFNEIGTKILLKKPEWVIN